MSTLLDQHCIGMLFSQRCQNTSETKLHKKCWLKARRYTFAGKPAVSNISVSLFLTGYYITEQSWVFLFNAESRFYLRIAGQQWTGADIDWNTTILSAMSVSIVRFFTVVKSPSTIRFIVVRWMAERAFWQEEERYDFHQRKPPKFFSWRVLFQQHAIWTFCQKDFDRLFEVNQPFLSRYFLLFWGPLLKFLIFTNFGFTKSSSMLGQ